MEQWPTGEMILRSMNNRSNLLASPWDDPLRGIPITEEMMARAVAYQAGR